MQITVNGKQDDAVFLVSFKHCHIKVEISLVVEPSSFLPDTVGFSDNEDTLSSVCSEAAHAVASVFAQSAQQLQAQSLAAFEASKGRRVRAFLDLNRKNKKN